VTAQGHPRTIFKRTIEHGNFVVAEMTARELGRITLGESLALTALATQKAPERRSRYAVRWLRRRLEEADHLTIEEEAAPRSRHIWRPVFTSIPSVCPDQLIAPTGAALSAVVTDTRGGP
jgi:hypothetical protein